MIYLESLLYVLSIPLGITFLSLLLGLMLWEKGRRSLVLALRSLWLHKLRSFLSVLGIIIGTGAVIVLMAFGEGSMQDALEDIRRQGATNIIIRSVKPSDDAPTQRRTRFAEYGLTYLDYDRFGTIGTVTRRVPMRIFAQQIRYLEKTENGRIVGTTPEYSEIHKIPMATGRFLRDEDQDERRNVAVLGASIANRLFPFDEPLGHTVRLGTHFYVVIGVVAERMPIGGSGGSQSAEEFNSDVYIPLETCKRRFGELIISRTTGSFSGEKVALSQVTLTIEDVDKVRPSGDVVRALLQDRHLKTDWAVTVPLDRLEEAERARTRYKMLLAVIAFISLLVGGIGIMNIMLATVTERTREIGIRRALGAKRRDITLQFIIEAVVQTTVGGLVGVLAGLGLVYGIPWVCEIVFGAHVPARLHIPSIFISLEVAIGVGVLFGSYPAMRASRLDPIEALRHE
jgi:putative ABC transport system permease protein